MYTCSLSVFVWSLERYTTLVALRGFACGPGFARFAAQDLCSHIFVKGIMLFLGIKTVLSYHRGLQIECKEDNFCRPTFS